MNPAGLHRYQTPHAEHLLQVLRQRGAALDASDPGTGKTFVACAIARELGCVPFVVCPLSVRPAWRRAGALLGQSVFPVNYERARGLPTKASGGLCISPYGQEKPMGKGSRWEWAKKYGLVIFDEVDRCAGSTTLASKMLIAARRQAKYVLALSATAAETPLHFKALGYALGLHNLSKFWTWLARHGCTPDPFSAGFVFTKDSDKGRAAMVKLHNELFPAHGGRLRKSEIPGWPKSRVSVQLADIEEADEAKADELSKALAEAYQNRVVQAENTENKLTQMLRLRQGLELLMVPALIELTKHHAQTSKVLIFVNFRETIEALRKALSTHYTWGIIRGDGDCSSISGECDRQQVVDQFQKNCLDIGIVSAAAGGVGLSLHDPAGRMDRTSLIAPCYSGRMVKQILGRPERFGAAFSEQIFVYIANTLQERIALTLEKKLSNLDALNDGELSGAGL
jgi:hypothetical protein